MIRLQRACLPACLPTNETAKEPANETANIPPSKSQILRYNFQSNIDELKR
jgi:hypothetical protein